VSPAGGPTATTTWPRAPRSARTASVNAVTSSDPNATLTTRPCDAVGAISGSCPEQDAGDVGEGLEPAGPGAEVLAPPGQLGLGEEDVGEQRRLSVARAVADEHRRAPAVLRVLDRRLLAHATRRARTAPVLVGEEQRPGLEVDRVREDLD